jgi:hypothetical protein
MWHFRVMARGEINQDPTQEDYFNTAALGNFSDALVRESIQNSLDAKIRGSNEPVRVRITFPDDSDLPHTADAAPYLQNIWEHIGAADVVSDPPDPTEKVSFLVFEDFGTRGLAGDPELSDDPEAGERADFYYFWRNIGRGKKEGEERGRWGLGKTMFPASSRIHAFFGLTIRQNDATPLLMGQSVLAIHHIGGEKHYPYGYFGNHAEDQFTLPVSDHNLTDDFSTIFSLSREDETGLSVVVPYPREQISSEDVLVSVVKHYFFPILSGDLVVEIDAGGRLMKIDASSIDDIVTANFSDEDQIFSGTLALAKWFLSLPSENIVVAAQQQPNRSPSWGSELFTPGQIETLAEALDTMDPVCVRVPVYVKPVGEIATLSYFHVVLERDPDLELPLDEFIRSGITISGVHSLRESGVRALVIAEDLPISTMLGDSENPSHTEWQDRSRNFVGKYSVGKSTLAFVKDAPRGFLRLLNKRSEQIDDTALRHLFPDPTSAGGKKTSAPGTTSKPGRKRRPRTPVNVESRPRIFMLSKVAGGFTATITEEGCKHLPMPIRVRMAYDVRKGNPYKRWAEADFDLRTEPERIVLANGDIQSVDGNRLEIIATAPGFRLQVTGFDANRDLIVDVRRETNQNAT